MKIFSGTSNEKLSFAIADYLGQPLGKMMHKKFPSGETYCQFEENM